MTKDEVLAQLTDLIEEIVGVNPDDITADKTFADLNFLEIDLLEVVVAAEETYKIRISDDQMAALKTVGQLADFVLAVDAARVRVTDWERELLEQQAKPSAD